MSQGLLIGHCDRVDTHSLWTALTNHEKQTGHGNDVQDSFSFDVVRALSFEPLSNPVLHPENWRKLNAGLEISVRLTAKGALAIEARPWVERCKGSSSKRQFEDFVEFSVLDGNACTVFEIQLDELRTEMRGASMRSDEATIAKRKLVYLCYEHVLQRLARHFSVRVQTALLCLGDECRLMIRKMGVLENVVERVQPWPDEINWHRKYLALCEGAAVAPDELLAFFKASIEPLSEDRRLSILRQYLGKPVQSGQRRGQRGAAEDSSLVLLRSLTVVANPDKIPPLTNHPSARVEKYLLHVISSMQVPRVGAIAHHYCIDDSEVRALLRTHYTKVLMETLVLARDMVAELEYFINEHPEMPGIINEIQERLLSELKRQWDQGSQDGVAVGVRKKSLCKMSGFSSFKALTSWSQGQVPILLPWLSSL